MTCAFLAIIISYNPSEFLKHLSNMHQTLNITELQKYFRDILGTCSLEYQCYQMAKTFPPSNFFFQPYPFCTDQQSFKLK